ncbi:MAG: glycine oxidase ThiO [Streptosporangiales bacterium]|nr:glycine oxidase ThiO [Streptosporangiales bacterium]
MDADVIVVGGGVIGTAIAWRAATAGRDTVLLDPGEAAEKASEVAAGMLAPVSESVFGEENLLALNLRALDRFPSFAEELEAAAGFHVGLRTEGTLNVALDSGDLAALRRMGEFRRGIGLPAEEVTGRECRRLEPFLASNVAGGLLAKGDLSVDNRRYTRTLRAAAARAGVREMTGRATAIDGGTVHTPERTITAATVVAAPGNGVTRLDGIPGPVRKAIRPVKGQILRVRHPGTIPPVATRTIRAMVVGREAYLVPREDGEIVIGATQEERADRDITVGAVHDLLGDARAVLPAVSELILAETSVGLRPGSTDNGPVVGREGEDLIIAAGHFRNGILLSAVTADAVTALLDGKDPAPEWAPFTPGRFQ